MSSPVHHLGPGMECKLNPICTIYSNGYWECEFMAHPKVLDIPLDLSGKLKFHLGCKSEMN